ncbi:cytochrome P450 [Trematosphaeria pertusa]|uniref:Cytochrome P450 n=1 Tax=Trematosphaeria pertusa TaxID=390896 RepID=A0A6A6I2L4_9PLEO|nr:cytochrome P450 [Trematosphaeria pertusa]KAF2244714.1 cytochrome P450 [Trematosphaeria pertusa]
MALTIPLHHKLQAHHTRRFKNSCFIVKRLDSDLLVLSNKYLEELSFVPKTKLSNVHSQVQNILGSYTYSTFLLDSDQHVRVVQNFLTPNLKTFLSRSREELDFSFEHDVPQINEWEPVDIQPILQKMVARVSSRVFVGSPACRDDAWLKLCLEFPINVFATAFIMRLFPPFLHPIVAWTLPTRYRLRKNLKHAKEHVAPIVAQYMSRGAASSSKEEISREKSTLLEWMIGNAQGNEADLNSLSPRLMFLSLASIHSTSSATAAALFDLCAHPEYIAPLREEIMEITGGTNHSCKEDLQKLWKLDSFLRESQRCNPLTLLSPQRLALTPLTLSDGTNIPAGTHLAFPSSALFTDSSVVPNPDTFDGFRSYRQRLQPGESTRHLMVSTNRNHLYFGYGKQACPGRFFAANEIKMILIRFLMEYDIRFAEGKKKPKWWTIDEMVFADPRARVEMRKRDI